jgi:hypothetical protein
MPLRRSRFCNFILWMQKFSFQANGSLRNMRVDCSFPQSKYTALSEPLRRPFSWVRNHAAKTNVRHSGPKTSEPKVIRQKAMTPAPRN